MKVANVYDLAKMEKGKDYEIELANHRNGLEEIAQQKKMDHDIAMFSLKTLQIKKDKLQTKSSKSFFSKMRKNLQVIKMLSTGLLRKHKTPLIMRLNLLKINALISLPSESGAGR